MKTQFVQALLKIQDWDGRDITELKRRIENAEKLINGREDYAEMFYQQIHDLPCAPPDFLYFVQGLPIIYSVDIAGYCLFLIRDNGDAKWETAAIYDLIVEDFLNDEGLRCEEISEKFARDVRRLLDCKELQE
ncbi:MAG TPA: hypothetical protein PLV45_09200 [bacterium]|jgi:hypothetical protein|nr:hypothetical protein [bacterium]